MTWTIGQAFHFPLGPMITCAVLVLCLRRAWLNLPAAAPAANTKVVYPAPLGATP